jgi:hypothetical protein
MTTAFWNALETPEPVLLRPAIMTIERLGEFQGVRILTARGYLDLPPPG